MSYEKLILFAGAVVTLGAFVRRSNGIARMVDKCGYCAGE